MLQKVLNKSIVAFLLFIALLSNNAIASEVLKENAIKIAITSKFVADPMVPKDQITIKIDANSGVVTLAGVVDTSIQVEKAVELAMSVEGVNDVDTRDLKLSTDKNVVESTILTAKTKGKIMHLATYSKISKDYEIHVETNSNKVYLKGTVAKQKDISTILNAVKKIQGVKTVESDIKVK